MKPAFGTKIVPRRQITGRVIKSCMVVVVTLTILFAPNLCLAAGSTSASAIQVSDEVQIHRTVTGGFVHPGIGLTKDMLENARAQILAKREPWYSDRAAAIQEIIAACDPKVPCVAATWQKYQEIFKQVSGGVNQLSDPAFAAKLRDLRAAVKKLQPLTPLLPGGSVDFPKLVVSSNIGEQIALLTDGNDDTFPVYYLAKDLNYTFDFGSNYAFNPFHSRSESDQLELPFFAHSKARRWTI